MPEVPSPNAAKSEKVKPAPAPESKILAKLEEAPSLMKKGPVAVTCSRWKVLETAKANVSGVYTQFFKNQIINGQHYGTAQIAAIQAAGIQLEPTADIVEEVSNEGNAILWPLQK